MKRFALVLSLAFPISAGAADLDQLNLLTQKQFRLLSEDMAAVASYKALTPAEPLGFPGFDLGIEVTATELQNVDVWKIATADNDVPSTVYLPKAHLHIGLPLGFDIGAYYGAVPDSNIDTAGAELRYAVIKGDSVTPAIAIRATYSKVSGVDQLDFDTRGAEITISKGFAFFTPYAGVGKVWVNATPRNVPTLKDEDYSLGKYFVGANFNFVFLNLAIEADKTGDAPSYGLKLGWRF